MRPTERQTIHALDALQKPPKPTEIYDVVVLVGTPRENEEVHFRALGWVLDLEGLGYLQIETEDHVHFIRLEHVVELVVPNLGRSPA